VAKAPRRYRFSVAFVMVALLMSSLAPTMQRVCAQMRTAHADANHAGHATHASTTHADAGHRVPADAVPPCCADHHDHDTDAAPCPSDPSDAKHASAHDAAALATVNADLQCCDLVGQHVALDAIAPRALLTPASDAFAQAVPVMADAIVHSTPVRHQAPSRAPPHSAQIPLFLQHAALLR